MFDFGFVCGVSEEACSVLKSEESSNGVFKSTAALKNLTAPQDGPAQGAPGGFASSSFHLKFVGNSKHCKAITDLREYNKKCRLFAYPTFPFL